MSQRDEPARGLNNASSAIGAHPGRFATILTVSTRFIDARPAAAETVDRKHDESGLGVRNEFPLSRPCKSKANQQLNTADGTLKTAALREPAGAGR